MRSRETVIADQLEFVDIIHVSSLCNMKDKAIVKLGTEYSKLLGLERWHNDSGILMTTSFETLFLGWWEPLKIWVPKCYYEFWCWTNKSVWRRRVFRDRYKTTSSNSPNTAPTALLLRLKHSCYLLTILPLNLLKLPTEIPCFPFMPLVELFSPFVFREKQCK